MALDLHDASFFGHALPEPFVKYQLETLLCAKSLLPKATGAEGSTLKESWEVYRAKLRLLGGQGGDIRVAHHVLEPLVERLGYARLVREKDVVTREGAEDGGWLFRTEKDDTVLRAWTIPVGTDFDAPNRRGRAYRYSPSRVAQRVLTAKGERIGLLTDAEELRILLCDPGRPDSHVAIRLDRSDGWRAARQVPDSYRLLLALAGPNGVPEIPELTDAARLAQSVVTKKLRGQARRAVEDFINELLVHPANAGQRATWPSGPELAATLWRESLVLVYRLLFIFKLESCADPAQAFSFATTSLWRNTYSPNTALGGLVRKVIDEGADTGGMLEGGLRALFRLFSQGLSSRELKVTALGGMLFGKEAMPILEQEGLRWGERAVAKLLGHLLWTSGDGKGERERVHYGTLWVEDLGSVYEALLELEPGISAEPMCRLRRGKLEVVLPAAQGQTYRGTGRAETAPGNEEEGEEAEEGGEEGREEEDEAERPRRGAKTKVQWVEEIPAGTFFLRVGLGRKSSGSYYTPHAFVRFLVDETLRPQIEERSPKDDPQPGKILELKLLDPAMGSGHFLVEACRYLGFALYEACRFCDERALELEGKAETAKSEEEREKYLAEARAFRKRVEDLPDLKDELLAYLPSRVPEGGATGLSQSLALSVCRRLVAVRCLYGVDKNALAVGLAKVSLWLESYAEGLPLTFLDHRLVCGDSLTGPFFEHLLTLPRSGEPIDEIYLRGLPDRLKAALSDALVHVRDLEASIGKDLPDNVQKEAAKARLDVALDPFKILAKAWAGAVMLGKEASDENYLQIAKAVSEGAHLSSLFAEDVGDEKNRKEADRCLRMVEVGAEGLPYDLVFPEVFHPDGAVERTGGFHAVVGNPPWDAIQFKTKEFLASFDFEVVNAPTKRERVGVEERILAHPMARALFDEYVEAFEQQKRLNDRLFEYQKVLIDGDLAGRQLDAFRVFMERNAQLLRLAGLAGVVVPSAFHANAGASGVRRLYLERMALVSCYSFENRRKLFDIDSRFKFAPVVARKDPKGTESFDCAFYLHDIGWLSERRDSLRYTLDFVRKTGGEYLSLLELRQPEDARVAQVCYDRGIPFGECCAKNGIGFGSELHMTNDSHRFSPVAEVLPGGEDPRDPEVAAELLKKGYLTLHEGKTFHQFDDHWGERPRYLVHLSQLADKPSWREAARYYRAAYRNIARSTDERTSIFGMHCPGVTTGEKGPGERKPWGRPLLRPLSVLAIGNSFTFDCCLRSKVAATVNLFILNGCPVPPLRPFLWGFFSRAALRLVCRHSGYGMLWTDQVADAWREPTPLHTWPVLDGDDARWAVRAAIDAVVADAYGLDRRQYEHVLSSFTHRSYPKAPELCLAAFDELKSIGLETFTRKHDPYWDIPLNESLPKPVIDLPNVAQEPIDALEPGKYYRGRKGQLELFAPDLGPIFGQAAANPSRKVTGRRRTRQAATDHSLPQPQKNAQTSVADSVESRDYSAVAEGAADEGYRTVLALLGDRHVITSRDAQAATGLDAAGVRPYLERLVADGHAVKDGQRRGTKYRSRA